MKVTKYEPTGEYLIVASQDELDIIVGFIRKGSALGKSNPIWEILKEHWKTRYTVVTRDTDDLGILLLKKESDDS